MLFDLLKLVGLVLEIPAYTSQEEEEETEEEEEEPELDYSSQVQYQYFQTCQATIEYIPLEREKLVSLEDDKVTHVGVIIAVQSSQVKMSWML